MLVVQQANGSPLAILNHNRPVFDCVPPAVFEAMIERIDDLDLLALVHDRPEQAEVVVNLTDL